jgi:eukaryotic-like serine/threonine-protein kinase
MVSTRVIGGRYRIENPPIGQGGMGVVHKAFDNVLKKFVAIKTVRGGVDHDSLAMFEREWTVLTRLCHPNIIDILDIGEFTEDNEKKPYFVMPLLPGTTLDRLIKSAGQRLTPERIIEIICQACKGLQAAHDQGLVHRDLKPSNIFVLDDDTVKIIDFGVAHLTGLDTRTGLKGTLQYMAPEQVDLQPATAKSDTFSLGVVCYEALTGRKPFERPTVDEVIQAIRSHVPPPASELAPSVNELVSRAVHRALAKQPYHRYTSAKEFADVLRRSQRNERVEFFDSQKIRPRVDRAKKALTEGDYQFATELLSELESEGNVDAEISLLRIQVEQATRSRMIVQLLESARARMDEEEYVLAAQKVQSVLDLDPANIDALGLKTSIERQRSEAQIDKWCQIARQHLDNRLYTKARQAVDEILKIDRSHQQGREMLAEITREEQTLAKLKRDRQQLYDSALHAYRNGDISSALNKLERVMELGKQAPAQPNTDAQYLAFYNQVRSERDELHKAYAEGKKALETRDFARAFEICKDVLSRRPSDPLFQSLKIEIEDVQRQENSAAIAQYHSRAEAEPDLERKCALLSEALERFPYEQTFIQALKLTKERRDLVNSIVARARHYEAQGQFLEASNQWDILRNIYGQYPGLDHELRRLQRRQKEYVQEEAKTAWVEKIDRAMAGGEYDGACELTVAALQEFAHDGELVRLKQQAEQAVDRGRRARVLLTEGQKLAASGHYLGAIEKLRGAWDLDDKNRTVLTSLSGTLVDYARGLAERDWQSALPFVEEALRINPDDPDALNVSLMIEDARRREDIDKCLMEGRELQTAGKLQAALSSVEEGLRVYPNEIRLNRLRGTLVAALDSQRSETIKRSETVLSRDRLRRSAAAVGGSTVIAPVPRGANAAVSAPEPVAGPVPEAVSEHRELKEIGGAAGTAVGGEAEESAKRPPSDSKVGHDVDEHIARMAVSRHRVAEPERRSPWMKAGIAAAVAIAISSAVLISRKVNWSSGLEAKNPATHVSQGSSLENSGPAKTGQPIVTDRKREEGKAGAVDGKGAQKPLGAAAERQLRAPTLIHFETSPSPAKVVVDNNQSLTCDTPCFLPLSPGRHAFVVSAPHYYLAHRTLQVPSETASFVALDENLQTVQVSSNPPASTLFIDGESKGQTPVTLRLTVGTHKIRLEKADLKYEDELEVKDGDFQHVFITLGRPQTTP